VRELLATLECELLNRHRFRTQAAARLAILDFIEGWYNPRLSFLHSGSITGPR
jgi:putative transposase